MLTLPKKHRRYYREYRRKKIIKKFLLISFLILIVLGGAFYILFFSPFFRLKEIEILGNEKVQSQDLRIIIEQKIFKKLIFFSSKSIFWLDFQIPEKEILDNYPQIATVSFKKRFPSKIIVEIEERKKIGIFYQETTPYLINKEGVIFEEAEALNSNFIVKSERTNFNLGDKVIEKENLEKILKIQKTLEVLEIDIEYFFLPSPKRLDVKTSEGWQIYFSLIEDLDWQITKLKLALENKIPPEKRGILEYIDVRFGNMVYPKYQSLE